MPRVSVVMAVRDGERYLEEAIASIAAQDFEDFELLIVDDGSRDSTPDIIRSWSARDRRIRSITLPQSVGIPAANNIGLTAATGEYLARHDHDDVSERGRLRAEVAALDEHRDAVAVSTDVLLIDAGGKVRGRSRSAEPPEVVRYFLPFTNFLGGGGQVMLRRTEAIAVGGFALDYPCACDYELWTRLIERGSIVILPVIGMRYRQHADNVSHRASGEQKRLAQAATTRAVSRRLGRDLAIDERQALFHLWYTDLEAGRIDTASSIMREAYGHFLATGADQTSRRRVRFITARQMSRVGAPMLWRQGPREFFRHMRHALSWHPLGLAEGLGIVVRDLARSLSARMRR